MSVLKPTEEERGRKRERKKEGVQGGQDKIHVSLSKCVSGQ